MKTVQTVYKHAVHISQQTLNRLILFSEIFVVYADRHK